MNWDAVGALAELGGAAGVIATLVYLSIQIRQNSTLLRSAVSASTREARNEVSQIIATNDAAMRAFWTGSEGREALSQEDRWRYDALTSLAFASHLQDFELGLGDYEGNLQWVLANPGAREWWLEYREIYSSAFQEYVDSRLEQSPAAQQSAAADTS